MDKPQKSGQKAGTFKKGPDPRRNVTIPGPGRPKDEWKAMLRDMASSDTVLNGLRSILDDPTHPQYLKALEFAAERGYGKEVTPVEQSGSMALQVVIRSE